MITNAGIYKIQNIENGRIYIGSAVNIHRRLVTHRWNLSRGTHTNSALQNVWNRYGSEKFEFKHILTCSEKDLLFYEQLVMDGYQSYKKKFGYNIRRYAESNRTLKGKRKYLIGTRFGHAVLVAYVDKLKSKFKCDCGKEFTAYQNNMVRGNTTSCGCFRKEHFSKIRTQHKAGDKFGFWTLLSLHMRKANSSNLWLCRCVCGREKVVDVHCVKSGGSKSCGCKKGELISLAKKSNKALLTGAA